MDPLERKSKAILYSRKNKEIIIVNTVTCIKLGAVGGGGGGGGAVLAVTSDLCPLHIR